MKKTLLMGVFKIKKIITAIGNPILNNELKKIEGLAVIENDIQYKDGIIELLEINKKIDYIILSELIPGEINLIDLIKLIKNINNEIKIIVILENNDELKNTNINELLNLGYLYKIIYNNKVEIKEIINLFNEDEKMEKYNLEIRKEIDELKEMIKNNQKIIVKNNDQKNKTVKLIIKIKNKLKIIINKINNYFINNLFNKKLINKYYFMIKKKNTINLKNINSKIIKEKNSEKLNIEKNNKTINYINKNYYHDNIIKNNKKIISILGNNGAGKSTFTVMLANLLKDKNNKILIIDFDILNNSLHTILGVKKYSEKIKNIINNNKINFFEINIDNLIIKLNNKIDLISGINLIFNFNKKIDENNFKILLKKIFENYDYIIIDTTTECFFEYTKEIINMSDMSFFLTEANLSEISKSKRLLEIYSNNWNVGVDKIKIIFNKYNKNSIDLSLLKKLYFDYEIIGKINLNNNYESIINKKNKLLNCEKNILKLLENNKIKINN